LARSYDLTQNQIVADITLYNTTQLILKWNSISSRKEKVVVKKRKEVDVNSIVLM